MTTLSKSLRLTARALLPTRRVCFSDEEQNFVSDVNFDFDEADIDTEFLNSEMLEEEALIKKELANISDENELTNLVMIKQATPTKFVEFFETCGDQLPRKSYSLILKNIISCILATSHDESFLLLQNQTSLRMINKIKDQVIQDCVDNELVDLLGLISVLKKKVPNFSTFLNINAEFNQKLTREIVQRINSNLYDLRSLIRICKASNLLLLNLIAQPALGGICTILQQSPEQLNALESYIIIFLMDIIEKTIDPKNSAEIILRCIFKSKNRHWLDLNFTHKMASLKRVNKSPIFNRSLAAELSRLIIFRIMEERPDFRKMSQSDISNGLATIIQSNLNVYFEDFETLVFNALFEDIKNSKQLESKLYFEELLELIYLDLVKNVKRKGFSEKLPIIQEFLSRPINQNDLARHWRKTTRVLNNILLMNNKAEIVSFFKPLIISLSILAFHCKKAIMLAQFLPPQELKNMIIRFDAEHPELIVHQKNPIECLNFLHDLGLSGQLKNLNVSNQMSFNIIYLLKVSPKIIDYLSKNFSLLEDARPTALFSILNETYKYLPNYNRFYQKVLDLFCKNLSRSLRGADSKIPIHSHTPLVLLDILIRSFPGFEVNAANMVLRWIDDNFFLRYQLQTFDEDLVNKLIELMELCIKRCNEGTDKSYYMMHHLFNYYVNIFLIPKSQSNNSVRLLSLYLKLISKLNYRCPVNLFIGMTENFIPIDPTLISKPFSVVSLINNVQHIYFLYPQLIQTNEVLRKGFEIEKSIFTRRTNTKDLKNRDFEEALKLCQSKREVLESLKIISGSLKSQFLKQRIIIFLLLLEQRFGGILAQYPKFFKDELISNSNEFIRLSRLAIHFLDIDKLSPDVVKYIRRFASNPLLGISRFRQNYTPEIVPFMRKFCITEKALIDFSSFDSFNWVHKKYFFSAALLYDHTSKLIDVCAKKMIEFEVSLDSRICVQLLLISFHQERLNQELVGIVTERVHFYPTTEFDLYELDLLKHLIDSYRPDLKTVIDVFLQKANYPSQNGENSPMVTCRTFQTVSKHLKCAPYCRNTLALQAYEIPDKKIVVIESTADSGKIDFLCQSAIKLIEAHSPELKIVVVNLAEWIESSEAEKVLQLEKQGLSLR